MIQFSKLRLQGFKSFVDKTELEIGAGLNGIVGPNGCGKSNLVEALRWVMGEGSARRMRGDGMEDVIFAGTAHRSARNIAEVSLLMDNSSRTAPAAYNGSDEIEITRKIERDHGSTYKINGKTVRARDVQLLLADTMTGAGSPALVSQGRITQIISAKPLERRMILEESAGISGLYARRHEAETRLKAADANLQRVTDLTGGMEGRLNALKRQSRQAARYRNLSAQIRQLDILIAWLEWRALEEKRKAQEAAFNAAESIVAEKMVTVTQLSKTQITQSEELPALRRAEADAAAALQTQKIALMRLEEEEERLKASLAETRSQLEQTSRDKAHEAETLAESSKTLEATLAEQSSLLTLEGGEAERLKVLEDKKEDLAKKADLLENDYTSLMAMAAEARARREALSRQIARAGERLETLQSRKAETEAEKAGIEGDSKIGELEKTALAAIEQLRADIASAQEKKAALAEKQESTETEIAQARTESGEAQKALSSFMAELSVLEKLLAGSGDDEFPSVLHDLKAESGFEKALSRALGDSLLASLDDRAASFWRKRPAQSALPALPQGLSALAPHIKAPDILSPALSQIGFVKEAAEAEKLSGALLPGQAIVSLAGDYWRWDGFCIKAAAQDAGARHLEQKNKLESLYAARHDIEGRAEKSAQSLDDLITAEKALKSGMQEITQEIAGHERDLREKERDAARLREEQIRHAGALERLEETITRVSGEIAEIETSLEADRKALAALGSGDEEAEGGKAEELKGLLTEAREAYQDALRSYERFLQEQNSRKARLQAIGDERVNLQNRVIRSREQLKAYETREGELKARLDELTARPERSEEEKQKLLGEISARETERAAAAENLAKIETEVAETTKALREAESILGEAREARAAAHATLSALKEQSEGFSAAIGEKFDLKPTELSAHLSQDPASIPLDSLGKHKSERDTLVRERDSIGPVNLRADQETQELEGEMAGLLKEHAELMQAAQELRGAIQKINKEARERLLSAFEQINAHFQVLFTRLFQGGQASLSLIDSEDPLGAGLEIFAQPPGKSLQSLSLLSGGEQTMASVALIFAMFLTNPSPICVLDEIDAPLDDSNVDRVCDLLEEIAERGLTRFLVITHHRLSMARMDRLYGVTMAEKGISQLVSVDLQQSFDFVKEAA